MNRTICYTLSYYINDDLVRGLKVIPLLSAHGISLASGSSRFISSLNSKPKVGIAKEKSAKGNKETCKVLEL